MKKTGDNEYGYGSVDDIRRIYGLTAANIYVKANRNNWRRQTRDGRAHYSWRDVDASIKRRTSP